MGYEDSCSTSAAAMHCHRRSRLGAGGALVSDEACVVAAAVPRSQCRKPIEVICIHCNSGTASGEPLTRFTVVDVLAVDDALARQLTPWPGFRQIVTSEQNGPRYANHCPHCGAEQDDADLHSEPGDPFFDIPHAMDGSLRLIPLAGRVRLRGDEHFTIEPEGNAPAGG